MNINRHNYEEYFILYMDNELSSDERRMVETFVQQHPDLKEELDLLLHYKLEPDISVVFNGKEELMKVNGETPISLSNYEEWLVLYTDNELTPAQRISVEQFAAMNPAVKDELDLMMKAKLQPEEIVFPYKESLYRKEEKVRAIPFHWLRLQQAFGGRRRIAAAAILVIALGISSIVIINNNKKSFVMGGGNIVKTNPGQEKKITNPVTNDQQSTNISNPVIAEKVVDKPSNKTAVTNPANNKIDQRSTDIKQPGKDLAKENKNPVDNKNATVTNPVNDKKEQLIIVNNNNDKPTNNLPEPLDNPNLKKPNKDDAAGFALNDKNSKEIIKESSGVTIEPTPPSGIKENDAIVTASLEEGSENKKSRGLFRKIARTFDKRTNMSNPDDNRLLVGGLSFKLK